MKRPSNGSTPKQYAYARALMAGEGQSKKEIARKVGFAPSVANNVAAKIEKTQGFQNAVVKLATEANNMAIAVIAEYKARGLKGFSNKDLNGALNAIAGAFERFHKHRAPNGAAADEGNNLRKVFMKRVETQTITIQDPAQQEPKEAVATEIENDEELQDDGIEVWDRNGTRALEEPDEDEEDEDDF